MAKQSVSLDEFRELLAKTQVECLECGWKGHSLQGHLRTEHGFSIKDYREKHPRGRAASKLVAEIIRHMPREAQRTSELAEFAEEFTFAIDKGAEAGPQLIKLGEEVFGACPDELKGLVEVVDPHFRFLGDDLEVLAYAIQKGKHVYDSGPTGCGKTAKYVQLFANMEQPIRRVNMNGDVTYGTFIGSKEAKNRETSFHYGWLPQAMKGDGTRGYPVIIDEIDYTPPPIAAVLNPVMDAGVLYLPDTGEEIRMLPGFQIFATANTGGRGDRHGNYTGTEILNAAFLDRFGVKLESSYLPAAIETEMLSGRYPKAKASDVLAMVGGANEVREAFVRGEINVTLSTRKLMDFFEMSETLGPERAIQLALLNWTDEDDGQTVKELLMRKNVPIKFK